LAHRPDLSGPRTAHECRPRHLALREEQHARRARSLHPDWVLPDTEGLDPAINSSTSTRKLDKGGLVRSHRAAATGRYAIRRRTPSCGAVASSQARRSPYRMDSSCTCTSLRAAQPRECGLSREGGAFVSQRRVRRSSAPIRRGRRGSDLANRAAESELSRR